MPHLVGNHRDISDAVMVQLVQVPQRPSATLARLRDTLPARKLPRRRAAARDKRVGQHMTTNAGAMFGHAVFEAPWTPTGLVDSDRIVEFPNLVL